ncbi:MAG: IS630 family transposase [Verrucomicrobiota bacterium]
MPVAPVKVRRQYDATFKREAVAHWLSSGKSAELVAHELGLIPARLFAWRSVADSADEATTFMLRIIRGNLSITEIETHLLKVIERSELAKLRDAALDEPLYLRRKAQAVIFYWSGISIAAIMGVLILSRNAVKRYIRSFEAGGAERLLERRHWGCGTKPENPKLRELVLSIIHCPPSRFGFNRTSWTIKLMKDTLQSKGYLIGKNNISKIVKAEGFGFWKAKVCLTSNDPDYEKKVKKITSILAKLKTDEKFFSIDEFGPFAVKMRGGQSYMKAGQMKVVPQFQKSKGVLIVTAALELSKNQVTHFYSQRKNTDEMVKLLELLLKNYADQSRIYLSWDAASWHASKKFHSRVKEINSAKYRAAHKCPRVRLAPLPSRAQFLNVIESVFSGMAKAIIHNSDYQSVEEAVTAIDRYFAERNQEFKDNPRRAGGKIWGEEIVVPKFSEANNCKNPRYMNPR